MAEETGVIDDFIYNLLVGDSIIMSLVGKRVFSESLAQGSPLPAIIYQFIAGTDETASDLTTMPGIRVWASCRYRVVGVVLGRSIAPARPIADRIDELLHLSSGSSTDGKVHQITRQGPTRRSYFDPVLKVEVRELGGFFLARAS